MIKIADSSRFSTNRHKLVTRKSELECENQFPRVSSCNLGGLLCALHRICMRQLRKCRDTITRPFFRLFFLNKLLHGNITFNYMLKLIMRVINKGQIDDSSI